MGLIVRFKGGARAGEVLAFEDDVARVAFGRDPSRCDVVFPADCGEVSREHFSLQRRPGYWSLLTNRSRPVFIEGRAGHDDQRVEFPCELQVGKDGPILLVEDTSDDAMASTAGSSLRSQGSHTKIQEVTRQSARNRGATQRNLFILAAIAFGLWFGLDNLRQEVQIASAEIVAEGDAERDEFMALLKAQSNQKNELQTAIKATRESVYSVQILTSGGAPRSCGSAWSLGNGVLATNAHVAELMDDLQPGQQFVARRGSAPFDALPIESIELHPGYSSWAGFMEEFTPLGPDLSPRSLISACDVALLRIAPESAEALAPGLSLADDDAMDRLGAGDVIASIAFPSEGLVGGGHDPMKPSSSAQSGHITSLTDYFLSEGGPPSDRHLVQHDLPVAGGASGGVIINGTGQVVGLVSAGNFAAVEYQRIPVGGINFGQRADLVRELLDGTAETKQAERDLAWKPLFIEASTPDRERVFELFANDVLGMLDSNRATFADAQVLLDETNSLSKAGPKGVQVYRITLPEPGFFSVIAVAQVERDIDISVFDPAKALCISDESLSSAAKGLVEVARAATYTVYVRGAWTEEIPEPTPFRIMVSFYAAQ